MLVFHNSRICLGLMLAVGAVAAHAAEPIEDTPTLWLHAHGYDAAKYALLFAWEERSQGGAGPMVRGFRLAPRDGSAPFEVYVDENGQFIPQTAQKRLGIRKKNWEPRSISRPARPARSGPKSASVPPPVPAALPFPPQGVTLPIPDIEIALAEDELGISGSTKDFQRVSVFQDLLTPIRVHGLVATDGSWQSLGGGEFVWTVEISATGALGQRVHFARLALPEDARLIVFDSNDPGEAYGPFTARDGLWTPTCFAEQLTLECRVSSRASLNEVAIGIDRTTYRYRGFDYAAKQAGSCNNDISCFPEWMATGLGIGGVGSIGSVGEVWCTGALLADSDHTKDTPYFMTANHCVSSQGEANDIEVYWLYQTSECNGEPPDPATVPRSVGGATYLAGNTVNQGTDFSFLRLKGFPPSGITYLGFDTRAFDVDTEVVCIHHPHGDFKRISFGSLKLFNFPLEPHDRFHEVLWYDGTTEPGSSGSPLLLAANQRFIGQLYGGTAACNQPNETDHYGRFDKTYPLVEQWLGVPYSIYDADKSGEVNAVDVQLVVNEALNPSGLVTADFDESGTVDAVDIQLIISAYLNNTW